MTFIHTGSVPDQLCADGSIGRARPGVVGPDGVLYFPVRNSCDGGLALAISDDEGATWQHRSVIAPATVTNLSIASLGVDGEGNLYLAWLGEGSLPYLTISRDRGRTWRSPMAVAAPGVTQTRNQEALAVGERGHIAIAYLGSTDGGNEFNGYITESHNVLDESPMFWSATVNDPAAPLQFGATAQALGNREYYRTAAIGPDGTPWAGFHCHETPACPNARIGVVGRLVSKDLDADGRVDTADNCPFVANPDQLDRGGIDTTTPDGVGDACQCGDVTGNGIVNGQDANAIKRHALGIEPNPLFAEPGNCDVSGNGDATARTRTR